MLRTIPMGLPPVGRALISVKDCAQRLGLSRQRVRVLLAAGRLGGSKNERAIWSVWWPLTVTFGRRGPTLRLRFDESRAVLDLPRVSFALRAKEVRQ